MGNGWKVGVAVVAGALSVAGAGVASADDGSRPDEASASASAQTQLGDPVSSALLGSGNEQVYLALLRPLNVAASGGPVRGMAVVRVRSDELDVTTFVSGLAPSVEHMQHIHGLVSGAWAACPPTAADANHDGVVDVVEGVPYYGPILVPLDDALDDLGAQTYPSASAQGVLRYEQRGSVARIESALGARLDLERRVVAVHGVPPGTSLPGSTQTLPGMAPAQTLPVACGELVRVR